MPLGNLVTGNLRRVQAFDEQLREAAKIDYIFAALADQIMFTPNEAKRVRNIEKLKDRIVDHVENEIFPQAERLGTTNALEISRKIGPPINPLSEPERGAALFKGRLRLSQRLRIVQQSINAEGAKLDSRLARYWLEPAEGTQKQKMERLKEIHLRMEKQRKEFDREMRDFYKGKIKTRPSAPKLDFTSEMANESKKEIRTQARRAGTDSELAVFRQRGHNVFVWIAPNGASACPDCRKRQNVKLQLDRWEELGRPGSGLTICGAHCFCMLLPEETAIKAPSLLSDIHTRIEGVLTTDAQERVFNENRLRRKSA